MNSKATGILYICPTPIGNLEDITLRTLRILKEVDFIAAEDTRVTIKLLNHYNIKTPLMSYHKFSEKQKSPEIIEKLMSGFSIALVSDSGTPGISDPGNEIIFHAKQSQISVIPLPGCSAVSCAASVCNLTENGYIFLGFLPKTKEKIAQLLEPYNNIRLPIVIFESPKRIIKTLNIMHSLFGNLNIFLGREMTKFHEEYLNGTIEQIIEHLNSHCSKGEYTIIFQLPEIDNSLHTIKSIKKLIIKELKNNTPLSELSKSIASATSYSKNDVYKMALELQTEQNKDL